MSSYLYLFLNIYPIGFVSLENTDEYECPIFGKDKIVKQKIIGDLLVCEIKKGNGVVRIKQL